MVGLGQVEAARLPSPVEVHRIAARPFEPPTCRHIGIEVAVAVVLAPEFYEFASVRIGQRVGAFLKVEDIAAAGRKIEAGVPPANQYRSRKVGHDSAGIKAPDRARDIPIHSAFARQDYVEHLALGRIFGAVKIACSDFDADHSTGRYVAQHVGQRLCLGAWPSAVDHHISGRSCEAAGRHVAKVEGKPWNESCDVQRRLRRRRSEECCVIDRRLAALGRPGWWNVTLLREGGGCERGRQGKQAQLRKAATHSLSPFLSTRPWPIESMKRSAVRSIDERLDQPFNRANPGSMFAECSPHRGPQRLERIFKGGPLLQRDKHFNRHTGSQVEIWAARTANDFQLARRNP